MQREAKCCGEMGVTPGFRASGRALVCLYVEQNAQQRFQPRRHHRAAVLRIRIPFHRPCASPRAAAASRAASCAGGVGSGFGVFAEVGVDGEISPRELVRLLVECPGLFRVSWRGKEGKFQSPARERKGKITFLISPLCSTLTSLVRITSAAPCPELPHAKQAVACASLGGAVVCPCAGPVWAACGATRPPGIPRFVLKHRFERLDRLLLLHLLREGKVEHSRTIKLRTPVSVSFRSLVP